MIRGLLKLWQTLYHNRDRPKKTKQKVIFLTIIDAAFIVEGAEYMPGEEITVTLEECAINHWVFVSAVGFTAAIFMHTLIYV